MATPKHEASEPPDTLSDRFRDAIAPRTLMLGVGVLLLQFAFILSYWCQTARPDGVDPGCRAA